MAVLAFPRLRWLAPTALAAACSLAWAQTGTPAAPLPYHTVEAADHAGWTGHEARVEAVRDALIAAQVPGAIVALNVQAGDTVQKGQTLLQIDARMARQGAAASQAQVGAARAQLAVAQKEYERQKLADAEVYRLERIGKTASEQMARDGALITKHPLLIQKTQIGRAHV